MRYSDHSAVALFVYLRVTLKLKRQGQPEEVNFFYFLGIFMVPSEEIGPVDSLLRSAYDLVDTS